MTNKSNNSQKKYEKKYSEYRQAVNKNEGQRGGAIVRKGTDKFAKNYVHPAIKAVGSFTPAGAAIGLTDAYYSHKKGDKTSAKISAGMEAIPALGKSVKGVSIMAKNMANPAIKTTRKAARTIQRGKK